MTLLTKLIDKTQIFNRLSFWARGSPAIDGPGFNSRCLKPHHVVVIVQHKAALVESNVFLILQFVTVQKPKDNSCTTAYGSGGHEAVWTLHAYSRKLS